MAKDKLADTFLEEFKKRPWKSKKLQSLADGKLRVDEVKRQVSKRELRPWWNYDEDFEEV